MSNDHTTVKICDFGVSIDLNIDNATTRCGTDDYMAPEVVNCPYKTEWWHYKDRTDLYYDTSADIWALGVMTYELCVGMTPLIDTSSKDNWLPKFPQFLSADVINFISSCLNIDPGLRPTATMLKQSKWIKNAQNTLRLTKV